MLGRLTKDVPHTFWSSDAFAVQAGSSDALWFIRTRATVSDLRGAMTSKEVLAYIAHSDSDVIVQELITSRISGVTFVGATGSLSEAVPGRCDGILRGGARGARWAAADSGVVQWLSGSAMPHGDVDAISTLQARRLDELDQDMTGNMLEWIIKDDGGIVWVDLKTLSLEYLSCFGPNRPQCYEIGPGGGTSYDGRIVLPDTRLDYTGLLDNAEGKGLLCRSGSPLAHLCVSAYEAGVSVLLPETA